MSLLRKSLPKNPVIPACPESDTPRGKHIVIEYLWNVSFRLIRNLTRRQINELLNIPVVTYIPFSRRERGEATNPDSTAI
ncbi:MAG: hypothetical protein ABH878_04085 [bacterium]